MSPVYTYECPKCGYQMDDLSPYPPPDTKPCPVVTMRDWFDDAGEQQAARQECDGTMKRIPTAASFSFTISPPTYQKPKT